MGTGIVSMVGLYSVNKEITSHYNIVIYYSVEKMFMKITIYIFFNLLLIAKWVNEFWDKKYRDLECKVISIIKLYFFS